MSRILRSGLDQLSSYLDRQVARYICYLCFKHLIVLSSSGWLWGNKRGVIMMTNNLLHSKYCITLNSRAMQACFESATEQHVHLPWYAISSMKSDYVLYQDRRKGLINERARYALVVI